MSSLENKVAIVTGGSQGFGRAVVEEFLRQGASVCLCARTAIDVAAAEAQLRHLAQPGQKLTGVVCDVSSACEAQDLVEHTITVLCGVDILVNNAGIYGPIGPIESLDFDEWARAMEINVYGPLHVCRALIPHLRSRGRGGKIINISGGGATSPMPRFSAYAATKSAIVRLTETLAHELADARIDVNAVAPGALHTRLMEQVLEAGPELAGAEFFAKNQKWVEQGATPLDLGARLCAYLASSASDGLTGRLLSAQWDPWETLHEHREDIANSDVYTLRRITPKDRGFTWDPKAGV